MLRRSLLAFAAALLVLTATAVTAFGASEQRASPKEQVVYPTLQDTYLGLKTYYEPDDGSNYYAYGRIDVVDGNGYATQAVVYVCRGSDSYTKNFRTFLSELEEIYGGVETEIGGYLDLWWDNRIRNWVPYDFYGVEQTTITDPDGNTHEVTVVAVCGSEAFMEPYSALRQKYMKRYGRLH